MSVRVRSTRETRQHNKRTPNPKVADTWWVGGETPTSSACRTLTSSVILKVAPHVPRGSSEETREPAGGQRGRTHFSPPLKKQVWSTRRNNEEEEGRKKSSPVRFGQRGGAPATHTRAHTHAHTCARALLLVNRQVCQQERRKAPNPNFLRTVRPLHLQPPFSPLSIPLPPAADSRLHHYGSKRPRVPRSHSRLVLRCTAESSRGTDRSRTPSAAVSAFPPPRWTLQTRVSDP